MKTWAYALIAGLAALVIVAGVGGYFLGVQAGITNANSIRSRFMAERMGGQDAGSNPGRLGAWAGGDAGNGGAATIGTVKSVEGKTVTVTTRNGDVKVLLGDNTTVQKMAAGTPQDIQPGQRITAFGTADSSGTVTAGSIQLLPADR